MSAAPTTFSTSSSALQSALIKQARKIQLAVPNSGFTFVRLVLVCSPIWYRGGIVGTFTGTVPAAQYLPQGARHEEAVYLVLQDNGNIAAVSKGITGLLVE